MRKVLSFVLAMLVCFSMTLTCAAVEGEFVPSIPDKDSPIIKRAIMDDEDVTGCIVVTSIIEAKNKSTDITQEERDLLLQVYEDLSNGATLPIDEDYVIRHLFDINFMYENCRMIEEHGHKDVWLDEPGNTIEVTFNFPVDKYVDLIVMSYDDGVWSPIVSATNNGDGTVTCVFEHFCPVVFAVKQSQNTGDNPQTGDTASRDLILWSGLLGTSLCGLIAAVAVYTRKRKHA